RVRQLPSHAVGKGPPGPAFAPRAAAYRPGDPAPPARRQEEGMSMETGGGANGIRRIEAGNAVSWFTRAVDVGGRQAKGLFTAAALGVAAMAALFIVAGLFVSILMAAGLAPGEEPDFSRPP